MWRSAVQLCLGLQKSIEDKRKGKTHKLINSKLLPFGGLAQLARAPALQAGGHRFESDILHQSATKSLHMIFDILDNTKDSSRAISKEYEQIKAIKVKP